MTALSGCADSNTDPLPFLRKSEPESSDPKLFPPHYKDQITDFMRTYLSNPIKVKDAFVAEPALRPVAGETHYITCVRYNARDQLDVYQGSKTGFAIFTGGQLNQFLPDDQKVCAGLTYQRFPELEAMVP
jgi:hypothetical protein